MMQNVNPKIRIGLYLLLAVCGVGMVAFGAIEETTLNSILPIAAGVLMVASGGVATKNVGKQDPPKPDYVQIPAWAEQSLRVLPQLVYSMNLGDDQKRRVDQKQGATAPWLQDGRHRAGR